MVISKLNTGSSFGNALSYCLQSKKQPEILLSNKCYGSRNELTSQMNQVALLSNRVRKPLWHASLSFPLCDKITEKKLVQIAKKLEESFGLEDNQYVVIKHNDTPETHDHIHILINRVSIKTGKAIATSNSHRRMVKFCRQVEKDFGLKRVLSPKQFLSGKEKLIPRTDQRKVKLKEIIKEGLEKYQNYPEFFAHMASNGYKIEKGRGIAFIDSKKVRIKGSEVGFSIAKIEKRIEEEMAKKLELKLTQKRKLRL